MNKRKQFSFLFTGFFCILLFGNLNAQQTISQLKMNQHEKAMAEFYENGFAGLSDALARDLIIESTLSGLYQQSIVDKSTLINIVTGLKRGDMYAENMAVDFYQKADESARQLLAFSLSQYYFFKAEYLSANDQFNNIDPTYFSNEVNELMQFQKGVVFFSLKKFDESKPFFESMIQLQNSPYANAAHYFLGFIAFSKQSFKEANAHFNFLINDTYYKKVIPFYISYILYQLGDLNKAILTAEKYLQGDDILHSNEAKQLLATIYFNRSEFKKSAEYYENLLSSKVELTPTQFFELGVGYGELGNFDKSIGLLKSLSSGKDSLSGQSMFYLANAFLKIGDKKQARSSFSLSLSMHLSNERKEYASINYAMLSLELGFKDEGIKKMNEFIQFYPRSVYIQNAKRSLLEYFSKTNDFKQAIKILEGYQHVDLGLKPYLDRIFFGYALEKINEGEFSLAIKYLDSLVGYKSGSYYYPALFWQGEVHQRQLNFQESAKSYTAYLKVQSKPLGKATSANANYGLASAYYELASYSTALSIYEKILSGNLINDNLLKNDCLLKAADCALMLSDFTKAKTLYSKSSAEFNSDYAAFQLAIIEGINNPMEKISLLSKIEKNNPLTELLPKLTMEIADTYISEEKYELAIPYLKRFMKLVYEKDPFCSQALLKLGVSYFNLDRQDEAIVQYKRILIDYPSSAEAKDAMESAKAIYVENGKLDEFSTFLKLGGVKLESSQRDSLTFQFVQKKILDNELVSTYAAIENYLREFPNGLFVDDVLNYKVQLLRKEKKWSEILTALERLLSQKTTKFRVESLRLAATINFFELKNYTQAKGHYQNLLNEQISSDIRIESLRGLVRSIYFLRDWESGSVFAEQLLKLEASPDDQAYSNMIIGYQEQGNQLFDLSSIYFNKILNSSSAILKSEAAFQYAYNVFKEADYSKAERTTVALIEKYGSDEYWTTKCYILLGDIFISQKDYFNARATLKSVLDNSTSAELRSEATEMLKRLDLVEGKKD